MTWRLGLGTLEGHGGGKGKEEVPHDSKEIIYKYGDSSGDSVFDRLLAAECLKLPCEASVVFRDAVYFDFTSGECRKAKADDIDTARVIGLVKKKIDATNCLVQFHGVFENYLVLPPGRYFLSITTAGGIVPPPRPTGSGQVTVIVGTVYDNSGKIHLKLSDKLTRRV